MKATFTAEPVVWFEIEGEDRGKRRFREDGGLLRNFRHWCMSVDIYPVFSSSSGGGRHFGGYAPDDAERIVKWLREQGAERKAGA